MEFIIEDGELKKYDSFEEGHTVTVPEGVKVICEDAFSCKDMKAVILPGSVAEIRRDAFYGCDRMESIRLPEGLKRIGEDAFSGCRALREIRLPESLEEIGKGAF